MAVAVEMDAKMITVGVTVGITMGIAVRSWSVNVNIPMRSGVCIRVNMHRRDDRGVRGASACGTACSSEWSAAPAAWSPRWILTGGMIGVSAWVSTWVEKSA